MTRRKDDLGRVNATRGIYAVEFHQDEAEAKRDHARKNGRHPRIYRRVVRAENLSLTVWIVVTDRWGGA